MPRTGLGAVRFGFGGVFPLVSIRFSAGYSSIPMHRVIRGGPDPEKRPDRVKSEEADPPARVNGILMGMIPCFGDVIRNVVNRNHPLRRNFHLGFDDVLLPVALGSGNVTRQAEIFQR